MACHQGATVPIDEERLDIARNILEFLQEEPNSVSTLTHKSDEQCCTGDFAASIDCCREAYQLALNNHDLVGQGGARLHMGLHYFVARENEFDRAAEYCQEAARAYHTAYKSRPEAVALLGAARIQSYACRLGRDRWRRAMAIYILVGEVEGAPEDLVELACEERDAVQTAFASHTSECLAHQPGQTPSQPQSTQESSPKAGTSAGSVPSRHFIYNPEQVPSHPIPLPVKLGWTLISGSIISGLMAFVFVVMNRAWENPLELVIGLLLGTIAVLWWSGSVLWAAGHLICRVPSDAHAIMQYRNGELSVYERGTHWVIPSIERVCAFVPTALLTFELFPLEFKSKSLVPLVARLKINCKVVDGVSLFKSIDASPTTYLLGLPKPLSCDEIQARIKNKLESQAKQVIMHVVDDMNATKILEAASLLKRQARLDARSAASSCGVKIQDFGIEFYVC